ncbi:hypothetical protein I7I50_11646 [Histoplasma capsulatum G186AR]|uniref:Secreted protein n=1 Tax=Ajellomyces capsulatus TaxID=5037 RepID=A0A8H7Z5V6_AJECA|nr:hypothetical protein I7I52_02883 [Histoplasma capsulatum]QSS70120.1 hypothetical protein I7I50_11646 [Histoplasma capsulatum G186AR]
MLALLCAVFFRLPEFIHGYVTILHTPVKVLHQDGCMILTMAHIMKNSKSPILACTIKPFPAYLAQDELL